MQNFSLNLARQIRRKLSAFTLCAGVLPAVCAAAGPADLCKKTPAARQDALRVVDAAYRPIDAQTLQIGDVDFSTSRDVKRQFMIVAPLRAQPTTDLDGVEIHSELELLQKCADKNVFALNFSFDASTLPAGDFSEPLSVYEDEFGMKGAPLSAPIRTVTGSVKRFWISADLKPGKQPNDVTVLRLRNSGNLKSVPLQFAALADAPDVQVRVNECEHRLLAPSETCDIELAVSPSSTKDEAFEWPVDVGEQSQLTLQFERRRGAVLEVDARNR